MDLTALKKIFEGIRDEKNLAANTATRIGNAFLSLLSVVGSYLSRDSDDTASGIITFLKGLKVGSGASGISGAGDVVMNSYRTSDYAEGAAGTGMAVFKKANGNTFGEIDELHVRKAMTAESVEVRKSYAVGGSATVSGAASKIIKVEWLDSGGNATDTLSNVVKFRCYFLADDGTTATTNTWAIHDFAYCQTFNLDVTNKYYWRTVIGIGDDYIDLGLDTEIIDGSSSTPGAGDNIVQRGNSTDTSRMGFHVISAGDLTETFVATYYGINQASSSLLQTHVTYYRSPSKVLVATRCFRLIDYDGNVVPVPVMRGDWVPGMKCYYYDVVRHNGSSYIADRIGESDFTLLEPGTVDGATAWSVYASAKDGKGIKAVTVYYLVTTINSVSDYEAFKEVTGWTTTEQSVSSSNPYLWTYQTTIYTEGPSVSTVPHIIGTFGVTGKNGYSLYLSPPEIVVNTNNSGIVTDFTNAFTRVYFTIGDSYAVATEIVNSSIVCEHCSATSEQGVIKIISIQTDPDTGMSYGSGYVTFTANLVVGGTTYVGVGKVYFSANIYKVTSDIKKTNDSITAEVTSVKTRVSSVEKDLDNTNGNVTTLTRNTTTSLGILDGKISQKVSQTDFDNQNETNDSRFSEVLQTAESYSVKVGEIQSVRRNLLVGSAFRRKEEFTYNNQTVYADYIASSCSIVKNAGYRGTNAIYINITDTAQRFIGLKWEDIPITVDVTYMFTLLVMSPDITTMTQGAVIELRVNPAGANKSYSTSIVPSTSGVWQQITYSLQVPATVHNESTSKDEIPTATNVGIYVVAAGSLYICRPMMAETGIYTGYSLSEKDVDYIGGNMLSNSRLLTDTTGNNLAPNVMLLPTLTNNGYGECTTIYQMFNSLTTYTKDTLKWLNCLTLKQNTDYIFSMLVKGTGYVHMFLYCDSDRTNDPVAFVETCDGVKSTAADGWCYYKLTENWRRVWVHFRTKTNFDTAKKMTLTAIRQWYDSSSTSEINNKQLCTITAAAPKLELGATMTDYCESGDDMISKKSLLACGIDIDKKDITLTADKTLIRDTEGNAIAVFSVDDSGNPYIKTQFIKADEVLANGVTAYEIRQPMEAYSSRSEFLAGKSLSWRISDATVLSGMQMGTSAALDGSIINIYNATSASISFYMPVMDSELGYSRNFNIILPIYTLLRATCINFIYNSQTVYAWYVLVPFTISGSTLTVDNFNS